MRSLCSSTIPYPTGQRSAGAKSEAIIGVSGGNRPTYFERFRETPCADPHAGCCGGRGSDTLGYPIKHHSGHLARKSPVLLRQYNDRHATIPVLDRLLYFSTECLVDPTVCHVGSENKVIEIFVNALCDNSSESLSCFMALLPSPKCASSSE